MTVVELLTHLRQLNVELWLEDDRVRFRAPSGVMTTELRAMLGERKAEIGAFLKTAQQARRNDGPIPLSFAQQRLWFLDQLEPNSTVYTIPIVVRLTGTLDVAVLKQSLQTIVHRHEVLRTTFTIVDGLPSQVIAPAIDATRWLPLTQVDLSGVPLSEQDAAVHDLVARAFKEPFDLQHGPLMRATLACLSPTQQVIILLVHHIVFDAWSQNVFIAELTRLYMHFSQQADTSAPLPLPELPLQYADYALWQHRWMQESGFDQQLAYWQQQLQDLSLLPLMTDRPRPATIGFAGKHYQFALPRDYTAALQRLSQQEGCTLFMTLLAAWQVLLARITMHTDIVVGTPVANRNQAEAQKLIGFFVNTLVLRTNLAGNPLFREALQRVRQVCLQAYAHQDVPFEKLVDAFQAERDPSRQPLFQVMFMYEHQPAAAPALPTLQLEPVPVQIERVKFDLNLTIVETPTGLDGILKYRTDLFDERTIARLAEQLHTLLGAIIHDPEARIFNLPVLPDAEYQHLLQSSQATNAYPVEHTLHHVFEQQVARTPTATAVTYAGTSLTYAELHRRSNQLAWHLQALGIGPEVCVGLYLERSLDLIVGLLGILKAGGAYVPLDPALPAERLAFILQDARVSALVTQEQLATTLSNLALPIVCLDVDTPRIAAYPPTTPVSPVLPDHPAYVIYTSGSTGTPKGVLVTHANVLRLFAATQPWFQFDAQDVWTLFHSAAFDFSVWEIWGPLLYGGRLVVVPYGTSRSPTALYPLLVEESVTVLNQTPSAFRQLIPVAAASDAALALRYVIFGGEALELQSLQPWFARYGDTRPQLVNMYGITETTVHVTYRPITEADLHHTASVIGGAIPDLDLYLLDPYLQPVPIGVPGEIYVGGAGLARGYLYRPALTAERFVPHPFSAIPGQRLYKSGDLARRHASGELEYLGRIDQQVKIRGFRIELGEIEARLAQHPTIREVVVIARDAPGHADRRLVAYLVPAEATSPTVDALRSFLGAHLPEYMIPSAFVPLAQLPLTANGKLDRAALPDPEHTRLAVEESYVAPRSPLERVLVERWQEVLGVQPIGVHDNFFALGGNSIQAAVLINQIQTVLQEIVYVVAIFDAPTVAELAIYLTSRYPQGVARLSGADQPSLDAAVDELGKYSGSQPIEAAQVRQIRDLIPPLPPRHDHAAAKNLPAVFVLSPPRSGSTLLRVMLAGHPQLFAPPELELLGFNTLGERKAAFTGRDRFWLEGTIRAIMALRECDAAQAEQLMAQYEDQDLSVPAFYRQLQTWLGERLLVDKTPSYALDRTILDRAEQDFANARYIHLIRHPYGMIRSFEEAKLDEIFFRRPHPFTRRQLAELIWLISHQNIRDFFQQIPAARQHTVYFEDLVRDPVGSMERICAFLDLELDPAMLQPYADTGERMTDGPHAASRMLGDVKFHAHQRIDATTSDRWRTHYPEDFLGDPTWELAQQLGYDRPHPTTPDSDAWGTLQAQPRAGSTTFPCSFAQQRLWFIDQLQPHSAAYNIFAALRLQGRLDQAALQQSLDMLVARHESLRTIFAVVDGAPVQVISPAQPIRITTIDLRTLPVAEREVVARQRVAEDAHTPFDLACGPLLRVLLIQLDEAIHILSLTIHHIISDGWSQRVLIQELTTLYAAYTTDAPVATVLPPLPIQYADYAVWQRQWLQGGARDTQLAYWQQQLADAPVLELPTDHPRPAIQSTNGRHYALVLPSELSQELAGLSRREGATLFMVLLAAFQALLARYSGQTDIVVGTPIAGRTRAELEGVIGFFVNSLAIRADWSGNPTFREALRHVRQVTAAAYAHQDIPFEQLVETLVQERELSRHPLFQVMFTLQSTPLPSASLPELAWSGLEIESATAKLDLSLSLVETPQGVQGEWEYNTDLFAPATIAQLSRHFQQILAAIVADTDVRLADLPLLLAPERQQLLCDWATRPADYPKDRYVHQLFEQQAAAQPSALAVVSVDTNGQQQQMTYAELNKRANQLAHRLRMLGIGPEDRVAVLLPRSSDLVVTLLGILKAGGAYIPLDPAYPPQRIRFMLEDAQVKVLITYQHLHEVISGHTATVMCLDQDDQASAWGHEGNLGDAQDRQVIADQLAYIIYTSGSTGTPKGVGISHQSLLNLIFWHRHAFELGPTDCVTQIAGPAFDAATWELWPALTAGATIYLPDEEVRITPTRLRDWLETHAITITFLPTPLAEQIIDLDWASTSSLRVMLTGGDVLHRHPQRTLPFALVNNYGPTENTVVTTSGLVPNDRSSLGAPSIGSPIANTQVYILDATLQPVPVGVAGEIYIGGDSLARGYFHRPELTAEAFVPHPFGSVPGARLYRTGDRARWRADAQIEFLGRLDAQVKVRGFRIELGEIEAALMHHPGVQAAVVIVRTTASQDTQLVAYAVPQPGHPVTSRALLEDLAQYLPPYMLPVAIVLLDALPLTSNGKVDRRALPVLDEYQHTPTTTFVAPRTIEEWQMARLWEEVLDQRPIGVTDNFFELGGHSLLSVRLLAQIQQQFQVSLPLITLFQAPTVERLIAALHHNRSGQPWSALVPLQAAGQQPPFFCVHPIGGSVLSYTELARHLGTDRPIYGLQALGLDAGQVPDQDIPTMARNYLAEVRSVQPEGPYLLGGWSLGGVIAFEMARQLVDAGQRVALLALIDSALPDAGGPALDDTSLVVQFAHDLGRVYGRDLVVSPDELRKLTQQEQLEYVLVQARQNAVLPPDIDLDAIRRLAAVYQSNFQAFLSYIPAPLPQRIALLQSADRLRAVPSRDLAEGWRPFAQDVISQVVAGNHHSMMRQPHVQAVADWLRSLFQDL